MNIVRETFASSTTPPRRARLAVALGQHGPALALYLLLALLFTYPTVARLTEVIGGQQDALENYWNLWWTRQALLEYGQNPYQSTAMHHPFGVPLYFHTYNLLNGLLSLPIQVCCGTAAAYNLLNLFAFTLSGVGMYALVWSLTQRRAAAFVAGLVYAFSPYMAFHLDVGQPFMLSAQWMPLYLLFLLRGLGILRAERPSSHDLPPPDRRIPAALRLPGLGSLLVAALFLVLIGLTDYHYLSYSVAVTGLVALYEMARLRRLRPVAGLFGRLALVGGVFVLLFSPVLVPTLLEFANEPYARRPIEHSVVHSTDLVAFFLPSVFHPLWGEWAGEIFYGRLRRSFVIGGMATLGYTTLILGILAVVRDWRRAGVFVLVFSTFFILALGPYLQVNGVNSFDTGSPIPLPYLLYRELPFMDIPRIPSRFVAVVMLALAVLVGLGVAWLWDRLALARRPLVWRVTLLLMLSSLVLFEYWPRPFRVTEIGPQQVSPFYRELGNDANDYAIIDVPHLWKPSMFYQTYHEKPTVGGRISRVRLHPWWDGRVFGPLLQSRAPWIDVGVDESPEAWRGALACQNVRYVTFYKQGIGDADLDGGTALQAAFFTGIAPVYEDEVLVAYGPISDAPREPFWMAEHSAWHPVEVNGAGTAFRWARDGSGSLLAYPCGEQAQEITLRLNIAAFGQPRTVAISLNGQPVEQVALQQDMLTPLEVPLRLLPGENRIELRSNEPPLTPAELGLGDDPRLLSFHISSVAFVPR